MFDIIKILDNRIVSKLFLKNSIKSRFSLSLINFITKQEQLIKIQKKECFWLKIRKKTRFKWHSNSYFPFESTIYILIRLLQLKKTITFQFYYYFFTLLGCFLFLFDEKRHDTRIHSKQHLAQCQSKHILPEYNYKQFTKHTYSMYVKWSKIVLIFPILFSLCINVTRCTTPTEHVSFHKNNNFVKMKII